MMETEARALLGLSPTAGIKEARKAHRDRAKVFHPDRHAGGTPEDMARATATMARINLALNTLIELEAAGLLGVSQEPGSGDGTRVSAFRFVPRSAAADECFLCGATPATDAVFRSYSGFLIWISSHTFGGSFCRSCGRMLFRESQALNLTRGWWGIVIVPMVWALFSNWFVWLRVRQLGEPAYRDPSVVTPLEMPADEGRPVAARPSVWITSLAATAILVGWAAVGLSTTTPRPAEGVSPSTPALPLPNLNDFTDQLESERQRALMAKMYDAGSCWSSPDSSGMIQPVECTALTSTYVVSKVVNIQSSCPASAAGSVTTEDGRFACLRVKG